MYRDISGFMYIYIYIYVRFCLASPWPYVLVSKRKVSQELTKSSPLPLQAPLQPHKNEKIQNRRGATDVLFFFCFFCCFCFPFFHFFFSGCARPIRRDRRLVRASSRGTLDWGSPWGDTLIRRDTNQTQTYPLPLVHPS